ncbi:hypothetical protein GMDG_08969 [Pseudogymnoascus destructans 20631-21]|uniref:Uncharacterized protein n=1 Tax=Pseudogymnoascus destructans (strain ATCC MYA-4855 / 20631-21) TaxID=658429 RepID=L8FSY9_PSED2|nr:hypothetical protein GMDG_08969 [Pseudogymnoascus destructans 20631-21]
MSTSTSTHTTPTTMGGRGRGEKYIKKGICVHMVSITRGHIRSRINWLYCTIDNQPPAQSVGAIIVPLLLFYHLVLLPSFLSFCLSFFALETGGWGGGVIVFSGFAFLSLVT